MSGGTGMTGRYLLAVLLVGACAFPASADGRCGGADTRLERLALDGEPPDGRVVVEATVSATFAGKQALNGFYLAEAGADGLPVGLFVYAPGLNRGESERLAPGRVVRLHGRLGHYRGQRQLEAVSALSICGSARVPEPVPLELPATEARLRRLAGLPVRVEQPLTVTDNYDLGRYGSLTLAPGERLFATPDEGRAAFTLVLDDGSFAVNPRDVPYLDDDGTRRLGSGLSGLTGVLAETFDEFRIHPTRPPRWVRGNPRRPPPEAADGTLRLALFNVKNYFERLNGRGARSAGQRKLQRSKLVAAILALDADVLGLLEVANTSRAVTGLRDAINARLPEPARYRTVFSPRRIGDDAIRSVLLYRPESAPMVGQPGVQEDGPYERPPLWARFQSVSGGPVTVVVAHLKSKGGCPQGRSGADTVAGCWSERRVEQARALLELLDRLPGDRELLLGDLNAYAWEGPPALLRRSGLRDLVADALPPRERYTYVYRGRAGMLDYALAGEGLAGAVSGANIWHVNADEPRFLGYRGRAAAAREAGAYRSSDHDVVIVDLASP